MGEPKDKNAIYNLLDEKMDMICLGEDKCDKCSKNECSIAFAKYYIEKCREAQAREAGTGIVEMIPTSDYKFYDESTVIENIGKLLTLCHSCESNHSENCVINIARSCLEVIMFGESIDYPGNAITYLMQLNSKSESKAAEIMDIYKSNK